MLYSFFRSCLGQIYMRLRQGMWYDYGLNNCEVDSYYIGINIFSFNQLGFFIEFLIVFFVLSIGKNYFLYV